MEIVRVFLLLFTGERSGQCAMTTGKLSSTRFKKTARAASPADRAERKVNFAVMVTLGANERTNHFGIHAGMEPETKVDPPPPAKHKHRTLVRRKRKGDDTTKPDSTDASKVAEGDLNEEGTK